MNNLKSIMYQGIEYEIKHVPYPGKNTQVIFRENQFVVYLNNKLREEEVHKAALQALRNWMLEKAHELIKSRTMELKEKVGVCYKDIRIKDAKTRWGSCSSKGNLNFNFRIVMAPAEVMDYIIIHELCHLKHMNHSKEFWSTVSQYMSDYEKHKEWLKQNGIKLYEI